MGPRSRYTMPIVVVSISSISAATQESKSIFSDCEDCPAMVLVPAGTFKMGNLVGTGLANEQPAHEVTIANPIAVSVHEVTYAQWDACVQDGACTHRPDDGNWRRSDGAVAYVSWNDTSEYLGWLSGKSGRQYRLLTEAEWEYVTRAGSETLYPWGDDFGKGNAVCLSCDVGSVMTITVGQVPANRFGLFDTVGS